MRQQERGDDCDLLLLHHSTQNICILFFMIKHEHISVLNNFSSKTHQKITGDKQCLKNYGLV